MAISEADLTLFHGPVAPQGVALYARLAGVPGGGEWKITGRVRGPECRHARTLPATHPFVDLGTGESLLARAHVPDPCGWSPDLPALYRVSLEVHQGSQQRFHVEREFGFRALGVRRRSLYFEGKRWVVRAVAADLVESRPLAEWREQSTSLLVVDPPPAVCVEAAREGVLLVARATDADLALFHAWSQSASVAIVIPPAELQEPSRLEPLRKAFPNLLWAPRWSPRGGVVLPGGELPVVIDADELLEGGELPSTAILACRSLAADTPQSLEAARAGCDALQSDLAPVGDFAGYLLDVR